MWAYARAEQSPTVLFDKCAKEVVRRNAVGEEFSPQVLTNLAWSFTTARIGDESLFKAVAAQIDTRSHLRAFKPQELANLVWAFAASAMFYTPLAVKLFDKVAVDMSSDKNGYKAFSPHHMSIIAWSFGKQLTKLLSMCLIIKPNLFIHLETLSGSKCTRSKTIQYLFHKCSNGQDGWLLSS